MESELVNKVANSSLLTIDLEKYYPVEDFIIFDIKDYLFQGLILREKDFRAALKEINWEEYEHKILLIICSADAILPLWSYMLIAAYAAPYTRAIFQGDKEAFLKAHYEKVIFNWDKEAYRDKRIVLKGCSEKFVPASAYTAAVNFLQPLVISLFFGEPCSTVPIYKKSKD
ncbi:MAG: hypothetical protein RLZZ417_128 [Bacteroidota bacterium]|jgi:hypothetical protein